MADERILKVGVYTEESIKNLDNLDKKFVALGKDVDAVEKEIERANRAKSRLGTTQQQLAERTTRTSKTFKELSESVRQTLGFVTSLAGAFTFSTAIQAALKLDSSLDRLKAITGATSKEMRQLEAEVKRVSEIVGKPQTELADSLFTIKQAGFDGSQALNILEASAKASAAGLGETKVIADAVTSVLNLYGRSTISAEKATGIFVLTAREGKVSMDQFEAGLGKVLPVAKSLGIGFDQVSAALATMSRSGVDTKQAAAALASIMDTLAAPSTDAAKALKEAGITVDQLRANLADRGIIAVLGDLKKSFEGNEEGLNRLFPNLRGMTGVLTLVGDKSEEAARIQRELAAETGGSLKKAFEDVNDESLKYDVALQKLNNQLIKIGTENLPAVTIAFGYLDKALTLIRDGTVRVSEGLAKMMNGSIAPLENAKERVQELQDKLDDLESRKGAIIRYSISGDKSALDNLAKESGFADFEAFKKEIDQTKKYLAAARNDVSAETDRALTDLATRLGTKSIEAYKQAAAKVIANDSFFFGLGGLLAGYDRELIERYRRDIDLINTHEADLAAKRKQRAQEAGLTIPKDAPRVGRPGGGRGSPGEQGAGLVVQPRPPSSTKLEDDELSKMKQLIDQYDEFDNKVNQLTKSYSLLQAGVKANAIDSDAASNAYNNMVVDIAKTSTASGTFEQALKQSKIAVSLLDDAMKSHGATADLVQRGYSEMLDGLVNLAGATGTFEQRLTNSRSTIVEISRAVAANGTSAEEAKIGVRNLVEQLAKSSTESGVFATSVANANAVLGVMSEMVKAGALDIENARRIYAELGKTLVELHPNIEQNKLTTEAWNKLLQNGVSPLDAYQMKLRELSNAYRQIVESGGDAEKAQVLFSNSAAEAAKEYRSALDELNPKQQQQQDAIERVAQASSNAFSIMIQGAGSAKDALNGLLKSILDVISQLLILEPLKQAITTGIGAFVGLPSGSQGSQFAPPTNAPAGLASGGIAKPGRHYLVGEEGPELLVGAFEGTSAVLVGKKGPEHIIAPPGGGRVISNRETKEILSAMPEERRLALIDSPAQRRIEKSIDDPVEKRATGGAVTSGKTYMVGEEGPELMLLGNRTAAPQQRQSFKPLVVKVDVQQPKEGSKTIVNVHNYSGNEVTQEKRTNGDGIDVIDIVVGTVTRNIDERGSISKAITRSNRLVRR